MNVQMKMGKMLFTNNNDKCVNPNGSLGMDEACLSIINKNNESISLYSIVDECNVCDGLPWANLNPNSNTTLLVSTRYPLHMYYEKQKAQWCHTTFTFQEHGKYGWNLTDGGCSNVYTLLEPNNPYLPLLAAFMIYAIALVVIATTRFIAKIVKGFVWRSTSDERSDTSPLQESDPPSQPPMRITRVSTRVKSIDTFRGIAVLLMVFVNSGGGKYYFFNHAPWYGLTVADLVLPWFAWIMGVTIVLSLRSQFRLSISRPRIILMCLRRSFILILLGMIINSLSNKCEKGTSLKDLRFPGVLQLLGITYFVCASIETIGMKAQRNFQYGRFAFLQDILDAWAQWLIILSLTATHLLITFLVPVPGCPKGYLGPGGYEFHGKYANCTGGVAGYIDRMVFGSHIYMKTYSPIVGPVPPHDPEGIMNTLSAILIVALGIQAGRILFCYYLHNYSKIVRWITWAIVLGLISGVLCNWSKGGIIPVSKNMMTLSFVLTTSCFAFMLFAVLYFLIDHLKLWDGAPFIYAGTNSIFIYIGHYFTMKSFPWGWRIIHPTHASLFAMNLWSTVLWTLIAYGLYRKGTVMTV